MRYLILITTQSFRHLPQIIGRGARQIEGRHKDGHIFRAMLSINSSASPDGNNVFTAVFFSLEDFDRMWVEVIQIYRSIFYIAFPPPLMRTLSRSLALAGAGD